jgi:putative selenate reductase
MRAGLEAAVPGATTEAAGTAAATTNLHTIVRQTLADERYTYEKNKAVPKRIDSKLWLCDCISCDKCIPVCPNDANFFYEIEPVTIEFTNYVWTGKLEPADRGVLKIEKKHQIANFADWCNECGNCDTFCPEYGGPFLQKPSFFANRENWLDNPHRDGFYLTPTGIVGRIEGRVATLTGTVYNDGALEVTFDNAHEIVAAKPVADAPNGHKLDVKLYHTLRLLRAALLNPSRVNQVNVAYLSRL